MSHQSQDRAFSIDEAPLEHAMVLRISGELDLLNAGALTDRVAGVEDDRRVIGVDLRGVSFIDSTGIRSLVEVGDQLGRTDRALRLIAPSRVVVRALELTGIDDRFDIDDDDAAFHEAVADG